MIRSAKTAWDGTSAGDIVKAARKLGYSAEKYTGKRLPETLCPYVLCVDRDEHWIAVLSIVVGGPLDPSNVRMLVIDSAHNDLCYTLQPSELEKRATGTSKKKPFSAVIIRRKPCSYSQRFQNCLGRCFALGWGASIMTRHASQSS